MGKRVNQSKIDKMGQTMAFSIDFGIFNSRQAVLELLRVLLLLLLHLLQ